VRERNFIDAVVKDEIVEQVTAELQNIVSRYLEEKSFPARLFTVKYREIRDLCAVRKRPGKQGAGRGKRTGRLLPLF
jgi:hypothetical protein